ncbi:hypothetical protein ACWDRX_30390, partial [Streptomyces nigra]
MRLAPETGIPGLGPAEPADVPELAIDADDPGTGQDRSTRAAATLAPSDRAHPSPSATSAMGGQGTTPAGGSILVPTPSATAAQPEAPGSTGGRQQGAHRGLVEERQIGGEDDDRVRGGVPEPG